MTFKLDEQDGVRVLENGDELLLLLSSPLPLAGTGKTRCGWVYIKEQAFPRDVALTDSQYGQQLKKVAHEVRDALSLFQDLSESIDRADDMLIALLDDHHPVSGGDNPVIDKLRSRIDDVLSDTLAEAGELGTLLEDIHTYTELPDEPVLLTVGIVCPYKAGVAVVEKLMDELSSWERPKRWSDEWVNAACSLLIRQGLHAPMHEYVYPFETADLGREKAFSFARELLFMAGFHLDRPMNAIGNTGWDFLKGDIGFKKGKR